MHTLNTTPRSLCGKFTIFEQTCAAKRLHRTVPVGSHTVLSEGGTACLSRQGLYPRSHLHMIAMIVDMYLSAILTFSQAATASALHHLAKRFPSTFCLPRKNKIEKSPQNRTAVWHLRAGRDHGTHMREEAQSTPSCDLLQINEG